MFFIWYKKTALFSGLGLALLIQQGCCVLFPLFFMKSTENINLGMVSSGQKQLAVAHNGPERRIL